MIAFIDDHRGVFGIGPICQVLGIAPSTFHAFKAVKRDPALASGRVRQDRLWVSDVTYVSTWLGVFYLACVIDVFARKIVGWRVSTAMASGFVLDALNQTICQHAPGEADKLIHHSDRSSQYLSIRYTQRLAEEASTPRSAVWGIPMATLSPKA